MRRHAKRMQKKAAKIQVKETATPGVFEVLSTSGKSYRVSPSHCTCKWAEYHPDRVCSHRLAVTAFIEEREAGRRLSFWADPGAAHRQHRPTSQVADVWATSRAAA